MLFPTPPFALETATTLPTPAIRLFFGARGQWGGVPDFGRPWCLLEGMSSWSDVTGGFKATKVLAQKVQHQSDKSAVWVG